MEITVRLSNPRGVRRALAAILVGLLLAVPTVAFGSHLFTDVPDSSPFHDNIADIETAGITAGCGGGKFCPASPITREQEAAFLSRGLSRAAASILTLDSSIAAADGWVTIAAVDIEVPGVSGTQRVVVHGEVTGVTDGGGLNNCGAGQRCYVNTRIRDITSGVASAPGFYAFPPDTYHQELLGRQAMFLGASGVRRYELQIDLINGSDMLQFAAPSIIATTFPLSANAPTEEVPLEAPTVELNGGL
jgi:hypothetical protein